MSEYSELIKRFDKIRDYMRHFYVYGFQSRNQLSGGRPGRSGRSYDNERRRIESYLADFMSFHQDKTGKNIFLSVDSGRIPENPLYRAFRAKSFTKNDITLHFALLDLLADGGGRTAGEAAEEIDREYLPHFTEPAVLDVSTIRKKLIEYEKLGMLEGRKEGKAQRYYIRKDEPDICDEALLFFSEVSPLGVVGSFLMEREGLHNSIFSWKHRYIMSALDSEVTADLARATAERRKAVIRNQSARGGRTTEISVLPLFLMQSSQNGRRYLAAYHYQRKGIWSFRLDYIKSVKLLEADDEAFFRLRAKAEMLYRGSWNVSLGRGRNPERLSMELRLGEEEAFLADRLRREGRHGTLEQISPQSFRYEIDVWDASEMLPWLRTFTGRILELSCTNSQVTEIFYDDLDVLYRMYGEPGPEEATEWERAAARETQRTAEPVSAGALPETPLFHEVYNSYYTAAASLIGEAQRGRLDQRRAEEIIRDAAFAESFVYMLDAVKSEQWQILTKDFRTPFKRIPKRPLTNLERQWIAAVRLDPRMQLFEDLEQQRQTGLEAPLYEPNDFLVTDRAADGDPYADEPYIVIFRTILAALRERRPLDVIYANKKGRESRMTVWPCRLEYSEKDDKFRLLCKGQRRAVILNLSRMRSCEMRPAEQGIVSGEFRLRKSRVELELLDQRNALERCMIHFADLEKRTTQLAERRYRLELFYRQEDETEILIRVLSFGPFLQAVGPDRFVNQIRERLNRQKALQRGLN